MPPVEIDGNPITGATIDGTDVQEITVDGDVVFSAGPSIEPVAYSNLIAWWPFDSSTYGGSNADDVTALFNPSNSGDSTAFNGTVTGATYLSSGGVKDINAGANSGAFDFDGSNDQIDCGSPLDSTTAFTVTVWTKQDTRGIQNLVNTNNTANGFTIQDEPPNILMRTENGGNRQDLKVTSPGTGVFFHAAAVFTGSQNKFYIDGVEEGSRSSNGSGSDPNNFTIGGPSKWDGVIEDVRIYNTDLSGSQILDIYDNTKP